MASATPAARMGESCAAGHDMAVVSGTGQRSASRPLRLCSSPSRTFQTSSACRRSVDESPPMCASGQCNSCWSRSLSHRPSGYQECHHQRSTNAAQCHHCCVCSNALQRGGPSPATTFSDSSVILAIWYHRIPRVRPSPSDISHTSSVAAWRTTTPPAALGHQSPSTDHTTSNRFCTRRRWRFITRTSISTPGRCATLDGAWSHEDLARPVMCENA